MSKQSFHNFCVKNGIEDPCLQLARFAQVRCLMSSEDALLCAATALVHPRPEAVLEAAAKDPPSPYLAHLFRQIALGLQVAPGTE